MSVPDPSRQHEFARAACERELTALKDALRSHLDRLRGMVNGAKGSEYGKGIDYCGRTLSELLKNHEAKAKGKQ